MSQTARADLETFASSVSRGATVEALSATEQRVTWQASSTPWGRRPFVTWPRPSLRAGAT